MKNWTPVAMVGAVFSFAGVAWALDGIPSGAFKVGDKPAIYYSNGKNHYCAYDSMENFTKLSGGNKWTPLPKKLVDYDMSFDGICTAGASKPSPHPDPTPIGKGSFKFGDRPAIYYSLGNGHYCWYRDMKAYKRLTGQAGGWTSLPSRLSNYGNIFDGECMTKDGTKSKQVPHPDPDF